jgi:hypothetical protein
MHRLIHKVVEISGEASNFSVTQNAVFVAECRAAIIALLLREELSSAQPFAPAKSFRESPHTAFITPAIALQS